MVRADILTKVGREFLKCNIENDEFSYQKALKGIGKDIKDYLVPNARRQYKDIDLRFADDKVTVLIETKPKLMTGNMAADIEQLQQYVLYERELTSNKVVAILYGTQDENIRVWTDNEGIINDKHENTEERVIRPFNEYVDMFFGTKNDKLAVIRSTYALNELLHGYGIKESIRSQFVGTCLLALKNGLVYEGLSAEQIRAGIEGILSKLLTNDLNKAGKLFILKSKVVDSQDIRDLLPKSFQHILCDIEKNILPYINDKSTAGQDLLNLFFTTFNKYVGKADKNQAFTPDHIVHFMCKVVGINRNSVVLDPCCGSGAFLVRAMTEAMADCDTKADKEKVKKKQIYGVEFEEAAFGLSTTNMLIHGDGNSNIVQGSCFDDKAKFLGEGVNVVLMNPPYNAQKKHCCPTYTAKWKSNIKEDPSKGFHFVYEIAEKVKTGRLAVLLPMQCAIGSSSDIQNYKAKMLEKHTLDAVFSLPSDMFHPGASASACCMVFTLGTRHINAKHKETFFGFFKDDGFVKRKNLGRVEKTDKHGIGIWAKIETEWLNLYNKRLSVAGKSCVKDVTAADEWLAEAYMETDYSKLTPNDFEKTVRAYMAYLVKTGMMYNDLLCWLESYRIDYSPIVIKNKNPKKLSDINNWKKFMLDNLFNIERGVRLTKEDRITGNIPLVTAGMENEGVADYISNSDMKVYKDKITIDMFCNCFYRGYEFACDDNILVLLPKFKNNQFISLFLTTVINSDGYRCAYGRQYRQKDFRRHFIRLPTDKTGNPDWVYMENYIKALPYGDII